MNEKIILPSFVVEIGVRIMKYERPSARVSFEFHVSFRMQADEGPTNKVKAGKLKSKERSRHAGQLLGNRGPIGAPSAAIAPHRAIMCTGKHTRASTQTGDCLPRPLRVRNYSEGKESKEPPLYH